VKVIYNNSILFTQDMVDGDLCASTSRVLFRIVQNYSHKRQLMAASTSLARTTVRLVYPISNNKLISRKPDIGIPIRQSSCSGAADISSAVPARLIHAASPHFGTSSEPRGELNRGSMMRMANEDQV